MVRGEWGVRSVMVGSVVNGGREYCRKRVGSRDLGSGEWG